MNQQILKMILQLKFVLENKEKYFLDSPNGNYIQANVNDKAKAVNNSNDWDKN